MVFGFLGVCFGVAGARHSVVGDWRPHPKTVPVLSGGRLAGVLRGFDSSIEALRERSRAPGIAVAIVQDDKVVYLKGFGYANVEKKLPMTPDTICMIASCSKAFTSTLALMGVNEGKLALSDAVRKYIPSFKLQDPEADAGMTVADLMAHTSGLPRTDSGWYSEHLSTPELIRLLGECTPSFKFRENAQYSNMMVQTASVVTANAFGEPWPELLRTKIFEPLHMDSSSTSDPAKIDPKRMAVGYWFDPISGRLKRERYFDVPFMLGAGGVKSTARDLCNWVRFHLGGGTFEGKQLISSSVLAEAYKPRMAIDDTLSFGLGWLNDPRWGETTIWHDGRLDGFESLVSFVPSRRLGIVVLTNDDGIGADYSVRDLIMEKLVGKPDRVAYKEYGKDPGIYVNGAGSHILRVWRSGDALWAMADQGKAIRLKRTGERTFETVDPRNPAIKLVFREPKRSEVRTNPIPMTAVESKLYVSARVFGATLPIPAAPPFSSLCSAGSSRRAGVWRLSAANPLGSASPEIDATLDGVREVYRKGMDFNAGISVDSLMDRMVAAAGGKALRKAINLEGRYEGFIAQEGLPVEGRILRCGDELGIFEAQSWHRRPIGFSHNGTALDSAGGTLHNERVFPNVGDDLVDAQIDAKLCQALDWRSTFRKVQIVGRQTFASEPVYVVLKLPRESSTPVLDFVSEKSFLVVRRETGLAPNVEIFGDYRDVEGVQLPFYLATIDSGFHREEMRVSEYRKLDRYPHWAFHPRAYDAPLEGRLGG